MLIGHRIMNLRRQVPDLPATLPSCPAPINVGSPTAGAGGLTPGAYRFVVTQTNSYGETLPSPEQTVTVGASGGIVFSVYLFPGVTGINVYMTGVGGASGTEIYLLNLPATTDVPMNVLISSLPTVAGVPPQLNSAFLPDSDGAFISASLAFTWVSEALQKISVAVGGLLNYSGVATVSGQGLYTIPGQWLNISDVWYGGYWIQGGRRADFFRRNTVTSQILNNVTISVTGGKQCIEVSYQPNRNSGTANTTSAIGTLDTLVGITNPSAFLLPFGFSMLGTPTNNEIVAYYQIGMGVMSKMVRGLGNTVAQAWPSGTLVTELSLFWCGKQVFNIGYVPGQSNVSVPVPEEWKTIIDLHVLSEAKKKEQDLKAWKELRDQAFADAEKWMLANRGVASFVQVGGDNRPIVYADTIAGGLVIPS